MIIRCHFIFQQVVGQMINGISGKSDVLRILKHKFETFINEIIKPSL